jgi:hypothetical protein
MRRPSRARPHAGQIQARRAPPSCSAPAAGAAAACRDDASGERRCRSDPSPAGRRRTSKPALACPSAPSLCDRRSALLSRKGSKPTSRETARGLRADRQAQRRIRLHALLIDGASSMKTDVSAMPRRGARAHRPPATPTIDQRNRRPRRRSLKRRRRNQPRSPGSEDPGASRYRGAGST